MEVRHIAFGGHSLPAARNEDRGSMQITHAKEGAPHLSSFGIFDGHCGSMAASHCAEHFNRRVALRFRTFLEAKKTYKPEFPCRYFTPQDETDAIVCESIRLTAFELDANIKRSHPSGSTLCSIFILHDPQTSSTRVYCANIGDSGCIMFTPNGRVDENSLWDAAEVSEHESSRSSSNASRRMGGGCQAYRMSEDHSLALPRERKRVENNLPCTCLSLPSEVLKGHMLLVSDEDEDVETANEPHMARLGFIELGYPSLLLLETASKFVASLSELVDTAPKSILYDANEHEEMVSAIDQTAHYTNQQLSLPSSSYPLVHTESFIQHRRVPNSNVIGPEAIFSKYNFSINMTRSIGDRYGPERVAAVPDITAVSIPKGQFARFILASDGVLDVLPLDKMKKLALYFYSPTETAVVIANHALKKRVKLQKRMDDISVIVVDVNPADASFATSASLIHKGCCTLH